MIKYKIGDILKEDTEALVNTVNCKGVMGRGIALQVKKAFPKNFKAYKKACQLEEVRLGQMWVFDTGQITNPRYIINFPTKGHWKERSRLEHIEAGLADLQNVIKEKNIRSIAIPPLGCGMGGLNWDEVRPMIEAALHGLDDVDVVIFSPEGEPAANQIATPGPKPKMTLTRAALVCLMQRYVDGLLDPYVTLLETHKLMYFMKATGEPELNKLRFAEAEFGPYSENLRHVLNDIEGHFTEGYGAGGDQPDKEMKVMPQAVSAAEAFLSDHPASQARLARVSELVEGFETSSGLELLATVHWVASDENEPPSSRDELTEKFYQWNDRKQQFSPRQIGIAADTLEKHNWISPIPA